MKCFNLMLLFLCSLFGCISNAQQIDVYDRPLRSEPSHYYDAIHYRVSLRFDDERKTFWGENTITLSPYKDHFTECVLDAETFTVTSVRDERGQALTFDQPPHRLIVHLTESYSYEDTLSFTVSYISENARPDPEAFGFSSGFALGLSFVEASPDNPPVIQAISWPTGARHWYPCYDHPHDKATQEMIITVRKAYKALSNGRLIRMTENQAEQTKTYHWSLDRPHSTYLSVLAAGPYAIVQDSLGMLPINYWIYEKDVKDAMRSFGQTPDIIAFFNEEFGYTYPWSKYDQVTIPGTGGGMECTTATLIGQGTIHDERADQDFPSHWLVAHEAAHQWWGDFVTLRDWGHTWLNESFGTYYDYVYTRHALGEEEGAVTLLEKKESYLDEAHNRYMRPIVFHRWNYPGDNFDRHTYPKGAAVIHMMRWILGDRPFRETVSHFLRKHAFQPVDTHDFLTAIKEATGQNFDWFFDQWLLSPGHPVFYVEYTWDEKAKQVRIRIAQVQDRSLHVPVFRTPVIIGIVTTGGKRTEKVWLEQQVEAFEFACEKKPLMVRFDEGNYLLKEWTFEKSVDELLYQLAHDDVIGRIWAASELSKFQNDKRAVEGLIKSASDDPFWAVRREAVASIGSFQDERKRPFLKERALDGNSKVRTAALKGLGDLKESALVSFFQERFENDDSYLAQAEALRSIGKCGNRASMDYLQNAARMKSPRRVIRRAAEWAMEQIIE